MRVFQTVGTRQEDNFFLSRKPPKTQNMFAHPISKKRYSFAGYGMFQAV